MKLVYLACPYTSPEARIRNDRAEAADWFAAQLMADGFAVISPLSQGHRMAEHLQPTLRDSHKVWMDQSIQLLRRCDELFLLPLEGWEDSRGVEIELNFAAEAGIPIRVIHSNMFTCQNLHKSSLSHFWTRYDLYI